MVDHHSGHQVMAAGQVRISSLFNFTLLNFKYLFKGGGASSGWSKPVSSGWSSSGSLGGYGNIF
jgi:hypothetical protein